ncbi:unnamed protein product [Phytomonas sp. Hart1]|nr:unnamed protein product [Phytomonas sp. Hart1]|eukprot:CCW69313.1 unnamed protein product [Phytomonas sp. isolate Hart1]
MNEFRQIQSMIEFIDREAQEKVDELECAAQEEYDIEKMRLVEQEKLKIRQNLEKKKKQVDVDRRVARANYTKTQRMRVMEERAKIMETLYENTRKKVETIVANPSTYRPLLVNIVRQSILAIQTDAIIQCRKEDETEIHQMLNDLMNWYQIKTGSSISIKINEEYLNTDDAWGGVVVSSVDGRIRCNNTLSYRATMSFEEQLPTIRFYLFNPEATV